MLPESNGTLSTKNPLTSEKIVLECPYPLITLGLKQVLRAAGYEVRSMLKGPAMDGETPSLVIYCPKDEGVGEDAAQGVTSLQARAPDACIVVLGLSGSDLPLAHAALEAGARGFCTSGCSLRRSRAPSAWPARARLFSPGRWSRAS